MSALTVLTVLGLGSVAHGIENYLDRRHHVAMKAKQTIASILAAQYVTENETEDHKIPFGVARYYGRLKAQTTMQEYKQHKIDMSTIEARLCEYELKQTRKEAYPWPLNRLIAA